MEYIPLIEETGQILDVTSYILKVAIRQKKLWQDMGYQGFHLGVNLSNKSLMKCGIDVELEKLVGFEYDINPKEFVLGLLKLLLSTM